jgi:N-acetylglucosaminyl-diphospho-decaprenol L-rhamnosyltransferase
MVSLDIIIVNWNAGTQLFNCLISITAVNRDGFEIRRVVVVDNASSDGSVSGLEGLDLPLAVIQNAQNRGFAVACNQGAQDSKSDYLLFLNPDVKLFADSLSKPIKFLQQPGHEHIGICGVKLLDEFGRMSTSCARFPSLRIMFGKMTKLYTLFPKTFPPHFLSENECNRSMEVDQVTGAFFLVRKFLFDSLHGFDERFFVYFEEVDFSLRARKRGFTSYYLSDVVVFHKGGGTTDQAKPLRLFFSLRSRILYGLKHFKLLPALILIFLTFSIEPITRIFRSAIKFSLSLFYETIGAYTKFTIYLLGLLFKPK